MKQGKIMIDKLLQDLNSSKGLFTSRLEYGSSKKICSNTRFLKKTLSEVHQMEKLIIGMQCNTPSDTTVHMSSILMNRIL